MPQIDAYLLNWEALEAVGIAMSFDAMFDCEWLFLMYFLPKIVEK